MTVLLCFLSFLCGFVAALVFHLWLIAPEFFKDQE